MNKLKRPSKKWQYYVVMILSVISSVVATYFNLGTEAMIVILIIASISLFVIRFKKGPIENSFKLSTHYDRLSIVVLFILGIAFILTAILNENFAKKVDFEWIGFLIFGMALIVEGLKKPKSFYFVLKSSEVIAIDDYELSIDSNTKKVVFAPNSVIVTIGEDEEYVFEELVVSAEDAKMFDEWVNKNVPVLDFNIEWRE